MFKIEKNNQSEIENIINPLIPMDNLSISLYEEILDYALSNPKINNIAITSPYGGGKSSIMRSYQRLYEEKLYNRKYKFIYIPIWELECEKDTFSLEKKIIRHLNFKKNKGKVNKCSKKIKTIIHDSKLIKISPVITIVMIIYSIFIKFNIINFISLRYKIILNAISVVLPLLLGIWIIDFINLESIVKEFNIEEIYLGGLKLNMPKDNKKSLIDENQEKLLEILDLVYNNSVIIFEDIDRYNDLRVFSELRELNYLANNRKNLEIKFIYLVRDDIFKTKEKTKFFDLIIPIIPVVDSSNSFDYLEDKLKKYIKNSDIVDSDLNNQKYIDIKFLLEISIYLDEIRLINHILNEFYVYVNKLSSENIDYTQLLSILVYKNLCPKNFQKYHTNNNYISYIFKKVDEKRIRLIENIYRKIDDLKKNKVFEIYEIVELEEKINYWKYCEDKKIFAELNENDYLLHDENLVDENLVEEIYENRKLLIYLLSNGHISRTTEAYIVTSDNSFLTSIDMHFYKNVIENKNIDFKYRLKKPEKIIYLLDNKYFERRSILNFDIINQLIISKDDSKLSLVLNMIKDTKSIDFINDYINITLYNTTYQDELRNIFITKLHEVWNNFFSLEDLYIPENNYNLKVHLALLFYLFKLESKDLRAILINEKLKTYIEENIDIIEEVVLISNKLNIFSEKKKLGRDVIIYRLNQYNYKIALNNNYKKTLPKFRFIYNENMYRYNEEGLMFLYEIEKIPIGHISILKTKEEYKTFWNYTNNDKNLDILLKTLFNKKIEIKFENEEDYIEILHKTVSYDIKRQLTEYIDIKISDIKNFYDLKYQSRNLIEEKRIRHDLVMKLVDRQKIEPNLVNLICIYTNIMECKRLSIEANEDISRLVKYINESKQIIQDKNIDYELHKYDIKNLFDKISNDLDPDVKEQFNNIIKMDLYNAN